MVLAHDATRMTSVRRTSRQSIEFDGRERIYNVFVPRSYDENKPTSLAILLHGGGGIGRIMFRFTGFDKVSEDTGLILLAPEAIERHWNDGRSSTGYRAEVENVDDVGFISFLIEKLSQELNINRKNVFAAGISNGGMMSHRLALELPDTFAAIAPVVASVPEPLGQKEWSGRPVPVIMVNGTEDPLVPFHGGAISYMKRSMGRVLAVPDAVSFWARRNVIASKPRLSDVHVPDIEEGMSVSRAEYKGDAPDQHVLFYAVTGAGHTWYGPRDTSQYLPEERIGRACHKFDATEAIWDFFQQHFAEVNND